MAAADLFSNPELRETSIDELLGMGVTHGQTLWILSQLGFDVGMTRKSFNYYVKSLRRLGTPFPRGETGLNPRRLAIYSFNHIMELSVALSLRIYAILPDLVLGGLIRFRNDLYVSYRRAYLERASGLGAPIVVMVKGGDKLAFDMDGVYLDLQLKYAGGQLHSIGPPRTLAPFDALAWFAQTELPERAHPPLNLSRLALKVAALMRQAPPIQRGPKPRHAAEPSPGSAPQVARGCDEVH
jgi:hypothetical protein